MSEGKGERLKAKGERVNQRVTGVATPLLTFEISLNSQTFRSGLQTPTGNKLGKRAKS